MSLNLIDKTAMEELGILNDSALPEVWKLLTEGLINVKKGKAVLPLDAYLRSQKPEQFNRIIAKLGIIGDVAGVKWIASAPLNTDIGLPRASGLLILNDIVTGQVYSILDAVPISNIRTGGVSMLFLQNFRPNFSRGVIVGAGVHAREHLRQLLVARDVGSFPNLNQICIYDVVPGLAQQMADEYDEPLVVLNNLEEVAGNDTAILYCTNALDPYVDQSQVKGYKRLTAVNMSLRDYTPDGLAAFDHVVADITDNVAQARTSVDLAIQAGLLNKKDCMDLPDLLFDKSEGKPNPFAEEESVIFNPMGLVSHDLLLGQHIYELTFATPEMTV